MKQLTAIILVIIIVLCIRQSGPSNNVTDITIDTPIEEATRRAHRWHGHGYDYGHIYGYYDEPPYSWHSCTSYPEYYHDYSGGVYPKRRYHEPPYRPTAYERTAYEHTASNGSCVDPRHHPVAGIGDHASGHINNHVNGHINGHSAHVNDHAAHR